MAIDRVTVNLPGGTAKVLEKRAASENRTVSNFVANLIESDLKTAGFIDGTEDRWEELRAVADEFGVDEAIEVLARAHRRSRNRASVRA